MDTIDNLDTLKFLQKRYRATKVYKKRNDPFVVYSNDEFRIKYRFSKENAKKVIKLVESELKNNGKGRGGSIPPHIQVLAAIRCWGRNSVQDDCADFHGFSQSTMSRICEKVSKALAKKATTIIKMATSVEEQILVMEKFKQIAGFENVMGAIDCTHIRIQAESGDDAQLEKGRKDHTLSTISPPPPPSSSSSVCT
ncbi:putative nuclease HARBI1 [Calliphora vicina]|uniref:putative nuclease HARBI1 n=1 Tax=Calliphora vicina TaxID=7373 RepID=UPI00325AD3B7